MELGSRHEVAPPPSFESVVEGKGLAVVVADLNAEADHQLQSLAIEEGVALHRPTEIAMTDALRHCPRDVDSILVRFLDARHKSGPPHEGMGGADARRPQPVPPEGAVRTMLFLNMLREPVMVP
jgi:hypothetical protein